MMVKIEEIKDKLEDSTIAVATVDKNSCPRNIAVMYVKVYEDKIVITNNYMKSTIENIKNNPNISLVFWSGEDGWRIDGKAEYYDSGKYLEFIKNLSENKGLPARGAIVVSIKKISKLC